MRNTASAGDAVLVNGNGASRGDATSVRGLAAREDADATVIVRFDTLAPVSRPGVSAVVRGMAGAGLPWMLRSGSGSLSCDGHLRVRISGLVLAGHPSVPVSLRGTNPFPAFRVVVSYLSAGPAGGPTIINVSTGDFEASPAGNSDIDARMRVPQPGLAPIVLVTGPAGAGNWLAATYLPRMAGSGQAAWNFS